MVVWKATATFDPARGTKWSHYAGYVCDTVLQRIWSADAKRLAALPCVGLDDEHGGPPARDDMPPADPVADAWEAFRRAMTAVGCADVLAVLTPKQRTLVELVAIDGLTVEQIAEQRGHQVKAVRRNLMAAVEKLVRAGKVTPAMVAAAGVSKEDMARWSAARPKATKRTAARDTRRAEVAASKESEEVLAERFGCAESTICADRRALREAAVPLVL